MRASTLPGPGAGIADTMAATGVVTSFVTALGGWLIYREASAPALVRPPA